jgi:hypothetical protein
VGQLADRDFATRDSATKGLRGLGRLALPALQAALATDSNPEVRMRVERLLPAAAAADLQARVDCFLADAAGRFRHDLPGGKAFFAVAGRSPLARTLFGDMMRSANRDLVAAVDGPAADLYQAYLTRRAEMKVVAEPVGARTRTERAGLLTGVDLTTLLFAESHLTQTGPATPVAPLIAHPSVQASLRAAMAGDPRREVLGAVLTHWVETRETPQATYFALAHLAGLNLPNGLIAARKLIRSSADGLASHHRALACTYVARFGTADDRPLLEGLFGDDGVAVSFPAGGPKAARGTVIQTRDVALAMCLLMSRQHPADYGLNCRYGGPAAADAQKFTSIAFSFDAETDEKADAKRDAAFKKYAEWKAKQPKGKQ